MINTSLSTRVVLSAYFLVTLFLFTPISPTPLHVGEPEEQPGAFPVPVPATHGAAVKKDDRWNVVTTEFGEISAVKIGDGKDGFYHLQFITMEPNSLFLPVHLHSEMVFYVDSGSGTLNWVELENDDDKLRQVELRTGDVFRLPTGSFFYLQSSLDPLRRKLRINAIFSDSKQEILEGSSFGAYASVRDLILGFDNRVLQAALNADERVIEELRTGGKQAAIVPGVTKEKANELWEIHYRIMRAFLGRMKNSVIDIYPNKKTEKAYNILTADHDVDNCNGWSLVVTSKQLDALKDSDFSVFMVNLTKGAMMGPHWNPTTAEIGVVVRGSGMVHVVCPGSLNGTEGCRNLRFRVEEGDVFVVPRYHPMAQMSFNNESFVFVGFTTSTKKNHPQYLAGSASVLQVLDRGVLAASFGVSNTTMDEVLRAQREAIILECVSCAEEEERLMEEEIEREKAEEEARRREEEEKAREEEEAREKEEEEAKRREEEARRREEEERREQEEARKRKEEEARRQEEEAARRQREQEEEARRKQEEAARRQREEEEAARRQQEEEAARRQEEEAARRQQQEEEEARRRQQEEADRRRQEEEESKHGGGGGGGGRRGGGGGGEGEAASRQEEEMERREREAEAAARGRGGGQSNSYEE